MEVLKQEEEMKMQLDKLEQNLLEELANSQGNILENKQLLDSLNKAKENSDTVNKSLEESITLQESLDKVSDQSDTCCIQDLWSYYFQERNTYLPLAQSGSALYFVLADLHQLNNMYRYSLGSFLKLFQRTLQRSAVIFGRLVPL